jgi:hypothetical protein
MEKPLAAVLIALIEQLGGIVMLAIYLARRE